MLLLKTKEMGDHFVESFWPHSNNESYSKDFTETNCIDWANCAPYHPDYEIFDDYKSLNP